MHAPLVALPIACSPVPVGDTGAWRPQAFSRAACRLRWRACRAAAHRRWPPAAAAAAAAARCERPDCVGVAAGCGATRNSAHGRLHGGAGVRC
eukprot:359605-Chlamydomonas_euryale.AAC.3